MTQTHEQDPDTQSLGGGDTRLLALRAYLRGIAESPTLSPGEEMALCRQIHAEHRALTESLLAIPSAARRLRAVCTIGRAGGTAGTDDILGALRERERARCEGAVRARVDAVIAAGHLDGSKRQALLASIDGAMVALPVRSVVVEALAAEVIATYYAASVRPVVRHFERLRDLKEALTRATQPLVVSVAVRFAHADVPLIELVRQGSAGLTKAVDRFQPGNGVQFSAYATWWIRQAIRGALHSRTDTALSA